MVAGVSVLHQDLDRRATPCTIGEALRDDGIAKPNHRFHLARVDWVCEIFAALADHHPGTDVHRTALSGWWFEKRYELRFRADERVPGGREGKHLFDGGERALAASRSGWSARTCCRSPTASMP